jgi:phytol kinase
VPLFLLTLADALAALVGIAYGRWRYATPDGQKTAEGSFTFFMVAFLITHILILLTTDVGRAETLLIAFLLAWLAMMFEAVAWAGLDNLLLPVVAFLLLRSYFHMSVQSLAILLGITTALTLLVVVYRRRTTLQGSALIGAVLVGYVTWTLGGWRWLLPPLLLFLCYARLSPQPEGVSRREHNMHAVVSVCSAGLVWLFLADQLHRPELLFLFTLAFAAHLAIIGSIRLRAYHPQLSSLVIIGISSLSAWAVLIVPHVVLERFTQTAVICGAIGLPVIALANVAFCLTQPQLHDCPIDTPRWLRQAAHAAIGSTLGLVPLYVF